MTDYVGSILKGSLWTRGEEEAGGWVGHFKDALWSSIAATLLSSASLCALTQLFSTCLPTCLPKKYFIRFPGNKQDFLILWHQLCRKWILDNWITRGLKFWRWHGSGQVRQRTLLPTNWDLQGVELFPQSHRHCSSRRATSATSSYPKYPKSWWCFEASRASGSFHKTIAPDITLLAGPSLPHSASFC